MRKRGVALYVALPALGAVMAGAAGGLFFLTVLLTAYGDTAPSVSVTLMRYRVKVPATADAAVS